MGNRARIAKMNTLAAEPRYALLEELSKERSDIEGTLLTVMGNAETKEKKFAAIFLFGRYRMDGGIHDLLPLITLEDDTPRRKAREWFWDRYPVVEALIEIGRPAVRHVLENIAKSGDEKARRLSADVIFYVEGPEVSRFIVQKAHDAEKDEMKRKRLKAALKHLAQKTARSRPKK